MATAISYDGGNTFSMLNANVANTGSLVISVPSVTATVNTCRIRVECAGNIFFDINDNNFTIAAVLGIHSLVSTNLNLLIAPNPFNSVVTVSAKNLESGESKIVITDILGKIILQETVSGNNWCRPAWSPR